MTQDQTNQKRKFGAKRASFGFAGALLLFPSEINSVLESVAVAASIDPNWVAVATKVVGLGAVAYAFYMQSTDREVPKK